MTRRLSKWSSRGSILEYSFSVAVLIILLVFLVGPGKAVRVWKRDHKKKRLTRVAFSICALSPSLLHCGSHRIRHYPCVHMIGGNDLNLVTFACV